MKTVELKPIKETTEDYDAIEKRIKELFRKELYYPLLAELYVPEKALKNSSETALIAAIHSGRVTFYRGTFSGRFDSSISKELRSLGATFDRRTGTYRLPAADLSIELRGAIAASEFRFKDKMAKIDRKLAAIIPEELAKKLKISDLFDRTLYKTQKSFEESVKGITIAPKLSENQRKRIADEWQNNMHLWIKDFTEKEITKLREQVNISTFQGNRYQAVVDDIQDSYDVSANKAKFLARQETALLMSKYQETQYQAAGIDEYHWYHVTGTPAHPVRPIHKELGDAMENGKKKVYRFSDPPVVDVKGNRKNPGQDYNCRCFSKPIVRFK